MLCKYIKPYMNGLVQKCFEFKKLPDSQTYGSLHILLDDCNFRDEDILFCLRECMKIQNKETAALGIDICSAYLKMSMLERSIFDSLLCGWNGRCEDDFSCCDICNRLNDYDFMLLDYNKESIKYFTIRVDHVDKTTCVSCDKEVTTLETYNVLNRLTSYYKEKLVKEHEDGN